VIFLTIAFMVQKTKALPSTHSVDDTAVGRHKHVTRHRLAPAPAFAMAIAFGTRDSPSFGYSQNLSSKLIDLCGAAPQIIHPEEKIQQPTGRIAT
jgi:hypothetical protein